MSVILIRSLILYILVIFAVRLMGKRQLGELQPSELVITILVSNIATLPLEDSGIPLIVGITPILSLVCFEVIVSWINLRSLKIRKIISGSPKIIISNGNVDPDVLRQLRFSVDDLMTALRGKDIFDISEVQFAVVETTGAVSVMKKQSEDIPSRDDLNIKIKSFNPPRIIISDGEIIKAAANSLNMNTNQIEKILSDMNIRKNDVFIMTADENMNIFIVPQNGKTPVTKKGYNYDKN
ncbi:MAG: DUF421 domain-containing protein [Ruminococcus sp.]|nr:DUF421 domain-containing protein [Ruminococcus sp.]HAE52909.1 DUF421 domain-containing protein [Ruminococcus sp.]